MNMSVKRSYFEYTSISIKKHFHHRLLCWNRQHGKIGYCTFNNSLTIFWRHTPSKKMTFLLYTLQCTLCQIFLLEKSLNRFFTSISLYYGIFMINEKSLQKCKKKIQFQMCTDLVYALTERTDLSAVKSASMIGQCTCSHIKDLSDV